MMDKHLFLTHQAIAEFHARNFELVVELLCQALEHFDKSSLEMSNLSFNALLDSFEMIGLMYEHLPVLEKTTFSEEVLRALSTSLQVQKEVDVTTFFNEMSAFGDLLKGIKIGFNFFNNNSIPLESENPILSFGLVDANQIQLFKNKDSAEVDEFVAAFDACFIERFLSVEEYEAEVIRLLEANLPNEAIDTIHQMMEAYPQTKKTGFLQIGELYFELKKYGQAIDAYMKTIVMGTHKSKLADKIKQASNSMAREAKTSKEANRWRSFIIDFFG